MGKARILSAQGEGRYSIEILEDRTRAESLKQRALQRIDEIDSELTTLEADLELFAEHVAQVASDLDAAIDAYAASMASDGDPDGELKRKMMEVTTVLNQVSADRDAIRTRIGSLNLERLQQQGWIDRVDALPPLRTQEAWCADYTEDLSGEVATAEVPGEAKQVIIKPGFEGTNQWSASEDGAIQPALASTPAGVFYNLAMMPGWQRWRPTFRVATISNINEDLCDIILDAATSSQQGLNVNARGSYSGVPIYYMDCNGAAFEDGDRVLVAFSGNTEQPMVVGFESEPKACCFPEVIANSSGGSEWQVKNEFEDLKITGGPLVEWRIVDVDTDEVLHSGGVVSGGGSNFYLDSLPESLSLRETLDSYVSVEFGGTAYSYSVFPDHNTREINWNEVIYSPYEGMYYAMDVRIFPRGTPNSVMFSNVTPAYPGMGNYENGNLTTGTFTGTTIFTPTSEDYWWVPRLIFIRPDFRQRSLRLEKGCSTASGMEWPK